jgi:glycosyltransferase involved in cell wall biosynthesis
MRPLRIALLTTDNREHHRRYDLPTPYFGPAIEALLQGLGTREDLEVHVVSCTQKPMTAPEKLARNVWFHLLDVPKIGWLRTAYQGCIRAVRAKARELQPDLVHAHGTERDCAISAIFSGFKNIVTIHGNMRSIAKITQAAPFSYDWFAARLERFTLPRCDGVICNSDFTKQAVHSLAPRTWLVPNALRLEFFAHPVTARSTSSLPIILNVGTVAKHKRQLELLQIAADLQQRGHKFELRFIGPANRRDPYAAEFLRQIESVPFAKYLGERNNTELIDALDRANALVHIPSAEAFGLVVGEALARDLKFFGTRIGGIPDIAAGVEGAELFELQDRQSLTTAISEWLAHGSTTPQTASDEMRERYHPNTIARRHSDIYSELTHLP